MTQLRLIPLLMQEVCLGYGLSGALLRLDFVARDAEVAFLRLEKLVVAKFGREDFLLFAPRVLHRVLRLRCRRLEIFVVVLLLASGIQLGRYHLVQVLIDRLLTTPIVRQS